MEIDNDCFVYLLIYVDDMLIISKGMNELNNLKNMFNIEFEMKDLGSMKRILAMDISRNREKNILVLSQIAYIKKVLEKYQMLDAKPINVSLGDHFKLKSVVDDLTTTEYDFMTRIRYSNVIGSLLYAMIGTKLDIAYAISLVNRFMSKSCEEHWNMTKWLLKYLKGTTDTGLKYCLDNTNQFLDKGYCDFEFAVDLDRRSLTDYVFTFGGNVASWKSNLQDIVALSMIEVVKESL